MEAAMNWIFFGVLAYLLGAVPVGLLVARSRGVDIRKTGSGNIGATNVFRSVGRGWGVLTFALDALKGWIPAALFAKFGGLDARWGLLFGALAVIGHNYPVWLRFKGGKGIATSAGMLLGVAPEATGFGLLVWLICFLAAGYVSMASIAAAAAVMAFGWVFYFHSHGWVLPTVLTVLGVLAIWRHRSNIERMSRGTENRFNVWKRRRGR